MQTFLPYPDFHKSAQVLDRLRLGKQRVEAKQILLTLDRLKNSPKGVTIPWGSHPAVKMWAGYEVSLCLYGDAICDEWKNRGYKDTLQPFFVKTAMDFVIAGKQPINPSWLGNEVFHSSHRAALLFKDVKHYSQFNWAESPKLDYIWPV